MEVNCVKFPDVSDNVLVPPFPPRVQFVPQEDTSCASRGEFGRTVVVFQGLGLHKVNQAAERIELVLELPLLRKSQLIRRFAIPMLSYVCAKAVVRCGVVPKACRQTCLD